MALVDALGPQLPDEPGPDHHLCFAVPSGQRSLEVESVQVRAPIMPVSLGLSSEAKYKFDLGLNVDRTFTCKSLLTQRQVLGAK